MRITSGILNERLRGYSRQMNEHAVPNDAGGYTFAFSISGRSFRIAGLYAVASAAVIAVLANATEPFRAPVGIALGVLTVTLLTAFAFKRSSQRQKVARTPTQARTGRHHVTVGKTRVEKSLASELALLADLHARGALSDAEFSAAKRRVLGD